MTRLCHYGGNKLITNIPKKYILNKKVHQKNVFIEFII